MNNAQPFQVGSHIEVIFKRPRVDGLTHVEVLRGEITSNNGDYCEYTVVERIRSENVLAPTKGGGFVIRLAHRVNIKAIH